MTMIRIVVREGGRQWGSAGARAAHRECSQPGGNPGGFQRGSDTTPSTLTLSTSGPGGPGWGGTQQGLEQSPAEGQEGGIISKPKKQAGTTLGTMGGGAAEHPEINLHQRLPGSVLSHCLAAPVE